MPPVFISPDADEARFRLCLDYMEGILHGNTFVGHYRCLDMLLHKFQAGQTPSPAVPTRLVCMPLSSSRLMMDRILGTPALICLDPDTDAVRRPCG